MDPIVVSSIRSTLDALERDEDIAICLAVESGSRAWGFPSADSDYDVRFIYIRRPEWYLSIDLESRRDTIERPIEGDIDLCGWDLRKALQLYRKSNPPLLEWLQCPIVYKERPALAARLRELLPVYYSPRASFHHYLHMARGNIREYPKGEIVWRKKYFYVLRPLLALRWIEKGLGPVPIEFLRLLDATVDEPIHRAAIDKLLEDKRAGAEMDRGPAIPAIGDFIDAEMSRLEPTANSQPAPKSDAGALNRVFRETLEEAWGKVCSSGL